MTSRNEITGEMIVVGAEPDSDAYDKGWDRIFGKKCQTEEESFSCKNMVMSETENEHLVYFKCKVCGSRYSGMV